MQQFIASHGLRGAHTHTSKQGQAHTRTHAHKQAGKSTHTSELEEGMAASQQAHSQQLLGDRRALRLVPFALARPTTRIRVRTRASSRRVRERAPSACVRRTHARTKRLAAGAMRLGRRLVVVRAGAAAVAFASVCGRNAVATRHQRSLLLEDRALRLQMFWHPLGTHRTAAARCRADHQRRLEPMDADVRACAEFAVSHVARIVE